MKDGQSYIPSNGTEGMWFDEKYCSNCIHQSPICDHIKMKNCNIVLMAMTHYPHEEGYPKEWIYLNGEPTCTNFVKWDWGNDGDPNDPDNPKAPPPPPDPNQIDLFPLHPNELDFKHKPNEKQREAVTQAQNISLVGRGGYSL